jgi:phosphatidylinositol phospholipase C delta
VKISVFDIKNEEKESLVTFSTAVVNNNGFFPIWNSEKFVFTVENGAVAMLLIQVFDKDIGTVASKDELIASSSIPISCLRTGYRSVQLFDANNTRSGPFDFASLLIEVKRKQLIVEI